MRSPLFRSSALEHLASPDRLDELIEVTDARAWLALAAVGVLLTVAVVWGVVARVPTIVRADGYLLHTSGVQTVEAPSAGRVVALLVQPGDVLATEQPVARVVRLDGQPDVVAAGAAGRVLDVRAAVGNEVERGAVLVSYERTDEPLEARLYLPPERARRIEPGMTAQLALAATRGDDGGVLLGEVAAVGAFPSTLAGIQRTLGSADLARALAANGPPVEVRVTLLPGGSGGPYRWRGAEPSPSRLALVQGGTPLTAAIIAAEQPPIALVLGWTQQ